MKSEKISNILKISAAALLIAGFLTLLILNCCKYSFRINQFNYFVAENRNPFFNIFFQIFTYLGSAYIMVALLLIMFLVTKNKKQIIALICVFGIVACFGVIIKFIVKSPRPETLMIIKELGYSFPSGHSVMISSFAYLFLGLLNQKIKNKPLKICLNVVVWLSVVLVGFSRIYLGVHYLTDVLAGFAFGLGFTMLLTILLRKQLKTK